MRRLGIFSVLRRILIVSSFLIASCFLVAWIFSYKRPYFTYRPIPTEADWFYVQRVKLRSGYLEATVQKARDPIPNDAPANPSDLGKFELGSFKALVKQPCGYYGTSLGKPFHIFIYELQIDTPLLPWAMIFSIWPSLWLIRYPARRKKSRMRRGLCLKCGYNLAGNTTGVCPECGTQT